MLDVHLEETLDPCQLQNVLEWEWVLIEGVVCRRPFRTFELEHFPLPEQFTFSRRPNVAIPIHVLPVGQGEHEAVLDRLDDDRSLVGLSALAACVIDDGNRAERQPGDPHREAVRKAFIDGTQPVR